MLTVSDSNVTIGRIHFEIQQQYLIECRTYSFFFSEDLKEAHKKWLRSEQTKRVGSAIQLTINKE